MESFTVSTSVSVSLFTNTVSQSNVQPETTFRPTYFPLMCPIGSVSWQDSLHVRYWLCFHFYGHKQIRLINKTASRRHLRNNNKNKYNSENMWTANRLSMRSHKLQARISSLESSFHNKSLLCNSGSLWEKAAVSGDGCPGWASAFPVRWMIRRHCEALNGNWGGWTWKESNHMLYCQTFRSGLREWKEGLYRPLSSLREWWLLSSIVSSKTNSSSASIVKYKPGLMSLRRVRPGGLLIFKHSIIKSVPPAPVWWDQTDNQHQQLSVSPHTHTHPWPWIWDTLTEEKNCMFYCSFLRRTSGFWGNIQFVGWRRPGNFLSAWASSHNTRRCSHRCLAVKMQEILLVNEVLRRGQVIRSRQQTACLNGLNNSQTIVKQYNL